MATYYIDPQNGQAENNGLSPTAAKKSYTDIDVQSGDRILFKRSSFIRDRLYAKKYVSYDAYGEGNPPTFRWQILHRP